MTHIKKADGILAWHWLDESRLTSHGENKLIVPGKTIHFTGTVVLCEHGYHGSEWALDALEYANSAIVQRCLLWGDVVHGADKIVASNRTCLWVADATRTLHEFAIWCAEGALIAERAAGREPHADSWKALEIKRLWLDGKATDEELTAAREAAWKAARAAWEAAWEAAREAAWEAAWKAAREAAREAAWEAARGAARGEQKARLEVMLTALAPKGGAAR